MQHKTYKGICHDPDVEALPELLTGLQISQAPEWLRQGQHFWECFTDLFRVAYPTGLNNNSNSKHLYYVYDLLDTVLWRHDVYILSTFKLNKNPMSKIPLLHHLQMGQLRHREVWEACQSHTVVDWVSPLQLQREYSQLSLLACLTIQVRLHLTFSMGKQK